MALSIKHNFVSTKADGTDNTLLRPSNWNDTHAITLATATLIGRQSAGTGAAEEIPCSAAAASLLGAANIAAILALLGVSPPTTGDVQLTYKATASAGWVMMNDGSVGDASSGASTRANADCENLFTLFYNGLPDAYAPVQTSAGGATTRAALGTAAQAWAAHGRIILPKVLGRALAVAGNNGTVGNRGTWGLGQTFGLEAVTLTANQIPTITSGVSVGVSGSFSGTTTSQVLVTGSGARFADVGVGAAGATVGVSGTFSGSGSGSATSNNTGGAAHENTPPTTYLNAMVKL